MKTTYQDVVTFINVAQAHIEARAEAGDTKFRYALRKNVKEAARLISEFNAQVEDLNAENAATDKDGILKKDADGRSYAFTKEGLKARNKAYRDLLKSVVEFNAYIAADVPADLTEDERDYFAGFILPLVD